MLLIFRKIKSTKWANNIYSCTLIQLFPLNKSGLIYISPDSALPNSTVDLVRYPISRRIWWVRPLQNHHIGHILLYRFHPSLPPRFSHVYQFLTPCFSSSLCICLVSYCASDGNHASEQVHQLIWVGHDNKEMPL